ncbi:MAG: hypothetical protein AB7D92_11275 [Sphaerochaeta sp.]
MKRKFITLFAALVLVPAFLFAVPVVVTWEWLLEDPLVTTFRYQVDGEEEGEWTTVDSSVTSYTERGLDGTEDHTLYLQQSYDGVHFSGSALSVAEAMFPPEEEIPVLASEPVVASEELVAEAPAEEPAPVVAEAPAEEPAPVVAEAPAEQPVEEVVVPVSEDIVAEQPLEAEEMEIASQEPATEELVAEAPAEQPVEEPVEEVVPSSEDIVAEQPLEAEEMDIASQEPAVEEPAATEEDVATEEPVKAVEEKEKVESRFTTTITMGGTFNFQSPELSTYHKFNLQGELGVHLANLKTFNDSLGLGVDLGFAYSPYLNGSYGWRNAVQDVFAFDFSTVLSNMDQAITISVAPMLNISMGKVDLDFGLGGFLTTPLALEDKTLYGAFAKAAVEYHFTKRFSVGASAKYGLIFTDETPQFAEGTVYMGFSF